MLKQRYTAIILGLLIPAFNLACGGGDSGNTSQSGASNANSRGGAVSQAGKKVGWPEGEARPRAAQRFEPGFNLFEPAQDIELGKQVSDQMTRDVKMVTDQQTRQLRSRARREARGPGAGLHFPL